MSQIKKLAKKNKKFSRFTKDYFNYLNNIIFKYNMITINCLYSIIYNAKQII